jgi:DNA-binding MarR family transcriptional regulator
MIELNFPNPVSEEKDFYGRRVERERIERTLLAGSPRSVIILGERRVGKTSLQTVTSKRLAAEEAGRFVPLLLPPAIAIRSMDDYAKEILQSLCGYLGKSLGDTGLVGEKGQFQLTSLGQFTDATARLLGAAPGTTFIVCVDEFDAVLMNCASDEADKILGLTDYIIERSGLPLLIYFSMTRLSGSLRTAYESPVLASESAVIELGPLPPEEAVEMAMGLLGNQVVLEDSAIERLLHLSGGHPYFVKLLLDRLLAHHWRGAQLAVSQEMVEDVIPDAACDPRARHALDNIYKVHFSQQEQQLVLLLAERGAGVTGEELKVLGPGFTTAAKRLERRGYLERREEGGYDFRIKFLGWWLRDWEEFEEELERLVETKQRLDRLADPWAGSQPTVVTDEDLRRLGLRSG